MRTVFTALTVSSLLALSTAASLSSAHAAPIGRGADVPLLLGTSPYQTPVIPSDYQGSDNRSTNVTRDISDMPCGDDCATRPDVRWNMLPPALKR